MRPPMGGSLFPAADASGLADTTVIILSSAQSDLLRPSEGSPAFLSTSHPDAHETGRTDTQRHHDWQVLSCCLGGA